MAEATVGRRKSLNGAAAVLSAGGGGAVGAAAGGADVSVLGAAPATGTIASLSSSSSSSAGAGDVKVSVVRTVNGGAAYGHGHERGHEHEHAHAHGGGGGGGARGSQRRRGVGGPGGLAADEEDENTARWVSRNSYKVRPFMVFVLLTVALGVSLLVTGAVLRMEKAPPTLLTAVNLCYDTHFKVPTFFGSGTLCYSDESSQQTMALSDESLVSDVEYVAFVVFPAGDNVNGSVSLSLQFGNTTLFSVTQNLRAAPRHRSHHILEHSYAKGAVIPMYTEFPSPAQLHKRCNDPRVGCAHTLQYTMNSLVLERSRFRIASADVLRATAPDANVDVPPNVQLFAPNLTISMTDVWLKGDALREGAATDDPPAQMFIGFYQFGLSYVQAQGVTWIVAGVFVLAFGLGLALAPCCGGRPPKYRRH